MARPLNVFIITLIVYLSQSSAAPKSKGNVSCPEQLKEVDRIFKVLLLMSKQRLLPTDDAKQTEYCKDVLSLGKKVARYSRCESAFAVQVLTILSNGVKKPIKYICNEHKEVSRQNFACMTDSFVDSVNEKEAHLVKNLKYISANGSSTDALPLFCCSMNEYLDSLKQLSTPECVPSSLHTGKFIHDRIHSGSVDVLDLICSSYKTTKVCDQKEPKMMVSLRTPPPAGFSIHTEPFAVHFVGAITKMT